MSAPLCVLVLFLLVVALVLVLLVFCVVGGVGVGDDLGARHLLH